MVTTRDEGAHLGMGNVKACINHICLFIISSISLEPSSLPRSRRLMLKLVEGWSACVRNYTDEQGGQRKETTYISQYSPMSVRSSLVKGCRVLRTRVNGR